MAHKYGSLEDDRYTLDKAIELAFSTGVFEDSDRSNHSIEVDIVDEPLPNWAEKPGYYYTDSTMGADETGLNPRHIFGLTKEDVIKLIKDKAPKLFDLKDE